MDEQELGKRLGTATAKSAFGRDAEIGEIFSRGSSALQRSVDTVLVMNQAKKHPRIANPQIAERCKIVVVAAGDRHGHMDEIDRTPRARNGFVQHADGDREIARLHHVTMPEIAIADVITEPNLAWNARAEFAGFVQPAREGVAADLCLLALLDGAGLDRDIPLDGKIAMGDGAANLVHLAQHRRFVSLVNTRTVFAIKER